MTTGTRAGEVLSQEARERFDRDGFIVLDDPCGPELIDAVRGDADSLLRDAFDEGPEAIRDEVVYTRHPGADDTYHWQRVREAWKTTASIREMALSLPVLAATAELFGRKPLPFQTLNFPMGTEQHAHIDAFYFDSDPNGYMCGVWIALEDMDMDNGPLVYYPGSHKLPRPDWTEITRATGIAVDPGSHGTPEDMNNARARAFAQFCVDRIEQNGLEPQYGTIHKGQALIWSANLLHGGAPQNDKTRTRHSQVTHYYFEGNRHYRPFQTQDDYLFYSYPEWIREPPAQATIKALRTVVDEQVPAGSTVLVAGSGYDESFSSTAARHCPFPKARMAHGLSSPPFRDRSRWTSCAGTATRTSYSRRATCSGSNTTRRCFRTTWKTNSVRSSVTARIVRSTH